MDVPHECTVHSCCCHTCMDAQGLVIEVVGLVVAGMLMEIATVSLVVAAKLVACSFGGGLSGVVVLI